MTENRLREIIREELLKENDLEKQYAAELAVLDSVSDIAADLAMVSSKYKRLLKIIKSSKTLPSHLFSQARLTSITFENGRNDVDKLIDRIGDLLPEI